MKKLIDFYELTMEYTDVKNKKDDEVCYFDVFFRKNLDNGGYNVVCGLEEIIDYIKKSRLLADSFFANKCNIKMIDLYRKLKKSMRVEKAIKCLLGFYRKYFNPLPCCKWQWRGFI